MNKIVLIIASSLILFGLVACSSSDETANESDGEALPSCCMAEGETDGETGTGSGDETVSEEVNDEEEMILIPEMKQLEVEVEGELVKKVAHLAVSDLNYSLFVIEGYSLHAEEPGKDVLVFDNDDSFFIRIEHLGKDVDIEAVEKHMLDYATGTINHEYTIPLDYLKYGFAEIVDSDSELTTKIHFGQEHNGIFIKYCMYLPGTEAMEGVEPSFWAMLETIAVGE